MGRNKDYNLRARLRRLSAQDLRVSEIAKILDVSPQRVYALLDELREEEATREATS